LIFISELYHRGKDKKPLMMIVAEGNFLKSVSQIPLLLEGVEHFAN
jgi:hypothetical protein